MAWNDLTLSDKARMINLAVKSGITDLRDIQEVYNTYAEDGSTSNNSSGGGNKDFQSVKQRSDFKPTKFKTFLRKLYAPDNSDSAANRYGDFSRMYFGMPLENDFLYVSTYKPTISKNENAVYYGVKDPAFIHDVIELYNHPGAAEKPHTGVVDGYKTKGQKQYPWEGDYISFDLARELAAGHKVKVGKTPHTLGPGALGNFTVSRGSDERGDYLSYYDLWDVDPRRSHNAEERGFAKAYEIYDRIYGTFDKDGTFHPEGEIPAATITANKYGDGGPTGDKNTLDSPLYNDKQEAAMYNYLVDRGLNEAQAAGVLGNLAVESYLNADMHQQGGGPAYGLMQAEAGRQKAMRTFNDVPYQFGSKLSPEEQQQLDYIIEKGINSYTPGEWGRKGFNGARDARKAFIATDDVNSASDIFTYNYLRPGKPHTNRRRAMSQYYYEKYKKPKYLYYPSIDSLK